MRALFHGTDTTYMRVFCVSGSTRVCLHFRRGDFLKLDHLGYTVPDHRFVHDAMTLYLKWFTNVTFIIVSNDMVWCKKNIKRDNVVYSPFTDPSLDFALLTSCDHVIVTSGTFGWWGAWLSGGRTVYFSGFPRQNSWLGNRSNPTDYYPKHWIGIP